MIRGVVVLHDDVMSLNNNWKACTLSSVGYEKAQTIFFKKNIMYDNVVYENLKICTGFSSKAFLLLKEKNFNTYSFVWQQKCRQQLCNNCLVIVRYVGSNLSEFRQYVESKK